ncbi:Flavodoxin domain-containing protein [Cadophora sp. MPI-SDFR-AT-0126]|nr:Flavodoxin domain-containing protein [Leotiomycetes sp. MPI-SDFR-AT-0126]
MKILIVYATTSGTTRSIAERIQARIIAAGFCSVAMEPVETEALVADSDAIIIGSCIHAGSWMRKAKKVVKDNTVALRDNPKPTWAFSVGMPPERQFEKLEKQIDVWLSKRIVLEGHKLFYGAYQEKDAGECLKLFSRCFGLKFEDKRNWEAMDEWADEIVKQMRVEQQRLGSLG